MLTKRIFSSVLLAAVFLSVLFVDWLCALLITVFIVAGLFEFFGMLEKKGISIYKYFGIAMGAVIPLSILFRFELTTSWELLFVVCALLILILMQFRRRDNSGVIVSISTTIFGILYVSWFMSFLIKIRYLPRGTGLLLAAILITKAGDIGAYLVGMRFGRTPFAPRVSPNKSIEGALGGLVLSILVAVAASPLLHLPLAHLVFIGFLLGILGQLGDLSESLMKRDCQVKDSGSIFPGLGGVLDFIDSLIFTAPAFYFYINFLMNLQLF